MASKFYAPILALIATTIAAQDTEKELRPIDECLILDIDHVAGIADNLEQYDGLFGAEELGGWVDDGELLRENW